MQSPDGMLDAKPASLDLHFEKFADALYSFDRLGLPTSMSASESSSTETDGSDGNSIDTLDSESEAPFDEDTWFASGMSPKAMRVLGVAIPSNVTTNSALSKKKPILKLIAGEFDRSRDASNRLNLTRARQLFRSSIATSNSSDRSPTSSNDTRKSSLSPGNSSPSNRLSKSVTMDSPDAPVLSESDWRRLSVQHSRKASSTDVNKPLPSEPFSEQFLHHLVHEISSADSVTPAWGPAETVQEAYELPADTVHPTKPSPPNPAKPEATSKKHVIPRKHVAHMMLNNPTAPVKRRAQISETEAVISQIFLNLDRLNDVRAAAMINKSFYRAYQRHESLIVNRTMLAASPAAWELRQYLSTKLGQSPFNMSSAQRDMTTIQALEAFIVMRCRPVCRLDTIQALLGSDTQRKVELENAIWRIWTFCKLFGKGSGAEDDFSRQVLWLNGGDQGSEVSPQAVFGFGNGSGLAMRELEDMSEMWRCMECLLSGFRGREEDAQRAGLFGDAEDMDESTMKDLLQTWIYDVLSLGPKAVLTLSSCDFDQAAMLGLTDWTPHDSGTGRSSFLRQALEEVYRERLVADAQRTAIEPKNTAAGVRHQRSATDSAIITPPPVPHRLRPRMSEPNPPVEPPKQTDTPVPEPKAEPEQPQKSESESRPEQDVASPPLTAVPSASSASNPMSFSSLGTARNASVRIGSNLFPSDYSRLSRTGTASKPSSRPKPSAPVVDPTDKAIHLLVHDMGFNETAAKRALAMSDTGIGIDVQKAIDFLSAKKETKTSPAQILGRSSPRSSLVPSRQSSQRSKDYCEGTCGPKTVIITEPKRDRVQGLGLVRRSMSVKKGLKKINATLGVIHDEEDVKDTAQAPKSNGGARGVPWGRSRSETRAPPTSFRSNGGGNRSTVCGPIQTTSTPIATPDFSRSSSDLPRPSVNRLATLEEAASPTSIYSEQEGYLGSAVPTPPSAVPTAQTNAWMALAAASPFSAVSCKEGSASEGTTDQEQDEALTTPRARVTLTRVGTGKSSSKNQTWRLATVMKSVNGTSYVRITTARGKEQPAATNEEGEIIGYSF